MIAATRAIAIRHQGRYQVAADPAGRTRRTRDAPDLQQDNQCRKIEQGDQG